MAAPKILLIMQDEMDEAQARHVFTKYHFENPLVSVRRLNDAWNVLGGKSPGDGGEEGKEDPPDLIILSIGESDDPRLNLAQESRKNWLKEVPLILVAATVGLEEEVRRLNLPKTYCMGKPLGFFKLLEAMQKLGMYWVIMRSSLNSNP